MSPNRFPVPSNRTVRIAWQVAGVLAMLVLAGAVLAIVQLSVNYETLDTQATDRDQTIEAVVASNEAQDKALKEANRRLEANDLQPVPEPATPEVIVGEKGDTGDTGATGPPGETIVGPRGLRGLRGLPGETVVGPPGPAGKDGADSTVPGPAGKDGKDSTVPGPAGKDGKDGADSTVPGPPGADGKDGADSTVPGPVGPAGRDGTDAVPFTFLFTIPADETLPDTSPAQTYRCVISEPGGPFTCELVAA